MHDSSNCGSSSSGSPGRSYWELVEAKKMIKYTDYRQNWDPNQDIWYLEEGIDEENKDFDKCL